ncbi:hypothetical protein MMC24_000125 [Lignoscripta atroalba]|nr:hypothetical protein [Lignoscripta atroalba]
MLRRIISTAGVLSCTPVRTEWGPRALSSARQASTQTSESKQPVDEPKAKDDTKSSEVKPKRKTMAELDEELRLKLEGISGDGGAAGLELEDGRPVAMKRGVKNNMFRLI